MYSREAWVEARARAAVDARERPIARYEVRHTPTGTITVPLREGQKCLWRQVGNDLVLFVVEEDAHGT